MTRATRPSIGARLATAGVLAQLVGFAVDAWLHARDAGLAARESVFSLGNVGHALVALGLVLVVLGLAYMWEVSLVVPALLLLLVLGATRALPARPHDHGEEAAVAAARARAALIIPGLVHDHERGADPQPMDVATRRALADELVAARAVAMENPTVADAEAAGYRMVVPYVPLIGAHYLRLDLTAGPFAVGRPAMVLFDGTRPDSQVVGLSYYVASDSEPDGFSGGQDRWHRHVGLCLNDRLVVVGGEGLTHPQCDALGGHKADEADGWMVHAWVVPGWESPDGVFSAENRSLQ
jgi:hypothetical protein